MSIRKAAAVVALGLLGLASPALAEPDFLQVTNVAADDVLNIRSGPSARERQIGALANGDLVRNLGCRETGNGRWCHIELLDDMGGRGWVNGRYVREGHPRNTQPHHTKAQYWRVTNVGPNDVLNIRNGPSPRNKIVGALANGDRVRNLGCSTTGDGHWCHIRLMDEMGGEGYVNAHYLRRAN